MLDKQLHINLEEFIDTQLNSLVSYDIWEYSGINLNHRLLRNQLHNKLVDKL